MEKKNEFKKCQKMLINIGIFYALVVHSVYICNYSHTTCTHNAIQIKRKYIHTHTISICLIDLLNIYYKGSVLYFGYALAVQSVSPE